MNLTLLRRNSSLAHAARQREILESEFPSGLPTFSDRFETHRLEPLRADVVEILQVNVGKVCNQTCAHCHVDAGPDRRESMSRETAQEVINALERSTIGVLDITGGAPEMNPNFRWLVEQAYRLRRRVIDRCNLTILTARGFTDLPEFLAAHEVEIVASLPCYLEENCDRQRGQGVYERSIEALKRLNGLGYGLPGTGRNLTLIYNPTGPSLPPRQAELEAAYRRELMQRHGIVFTHLHTITNLPVSRFLDELLRTGQLETYLQELIAQFNPQAVAGVMCLNMLSVDWQGNLFDCDFNQMLELGLSAELPQHIRDFDAEKLRNRSIRTGRHCFACTAGSGSSCQGAVVR